MSENERKQLLEEISSLRGDIKAYSSMFEQMAQRVSSLEISEAKRQGRESVSTGKDSSVPGWVKISLASLGVATGAIAMATAVINGVIGV